MVTMAVPVRTQTEGDSTLEHILELQREAEELYVRKKEEELYAKRDFDAAVGDFEKLTTDVRRFVNLCRQARDHRDTARSRIDSFKARLDFNRKENMPIYKIEEDMRRAASQEAEAALEIARYTVQKEEKEKRLASAEDELAAQRSRYGRIRRERVALFKEMQSFYGRVTDARRRESSY